MKSRKKIIRDLSELPKVKFYVMGYRNVTERKNRSSVECDTIGEAKKELSQKKNPYMKYFIVKKI